MTLVRLEPATSQSRVKHSTTKPLGSLGWRRETGLSTPVKYFTDSSKAVLFCGSFMGFFCLVFVMPLSRLGMSVTT